MLAESGMWTEHLRTSVQVLLSHAVVTRRDGTGRMQQSTTRDADTMRASDKMESLDTRAALQMLQDNTRAPQDWQTARSMRWRLLMSMLRSRCVSGASVQR